VVPVQRSDRYQAIKKLCFGTNALASQVILARTISNESKLKVSCENGPLLPGTKNTLSPLVDSTKDRFANQLQVGRRARKHLVKLANKSIH